MLGHLLRRFSVSFGIIFCAVVVFVASFAFLYRLGEKPFWDYDEAIYANVIRDTVASGDVLTLKTGQDVFFDKPPLYFWTSMAADTVFHHPEFSYRLTAALAGIGSVILAMLISYELSGSFIAAGLSGLILLTCAPFLQEGRELRLDVPAAFGILIAVYSFLRGMRSSPWFLGIGIGLAFGFFFKSVVGLFSPVFMLAWSVAYWDFRWLNDRYVWLGALLCVAILLPWHCYELSRYGNAFWQWYVVYNTVQRYNGTAIVTQSYSSTNYLQFFFIYAAPWSELFALVLLWLVVRLRSVMSPKTRPLYASAGAGVAIFLIFIAATTKILPYLAPVYPFVAISVGLVLAQALAYASRTPLGGVLAGIGLSVIIGFGAWVSVNYASHAFSYVNVNDVITNDEMHIGKLLAPDTSKTPVYAYQYDYWDTIRYYSGGKTIAVMTSDQTLSGSFYLVVPGNFFAQNQLPPEVMSRLNVLYKGPAAELYKFTYR